MRFGGDHKSGLPQFIGFGDCRCAWGHSSPSIPEVKATILLDPPSIGSLTVNVWAIKQDT